MEEKWRIKMNLFNTIYFYRSWTGFLVYKVKFGKKDGNYYIKNAYLMNKGYQGSTNFQKKLLIWLIDDYLLNKETPFPNIFDKEEVVDRSTSVISFHIGGMKRDDK